MPTPKQTAAEKPSEFDFDAFLDGFDPPKESTVTIYARDRVAEVQRHQEAAVDAQLVQGDEAAARAEAKKAKALRDEMEKSAITFTLRALDFDSERTFSRREALGDEDVTFERVAKSVIAINGESRQLSAIQWQEFARRAGAGNYYQLAGKVVELSQTAVALPDFSEIVSGLLPGGKSS